MFSISYAFNHDAVQFEDNTVLKIILGSPGSGRNDCKSIVFGHFQITLIQHRLIRGTGFHNRRLAVVWDNDSWNALEVVEHLDMSSCPAGQFGVRVGFDEGVL